LLDQEVSDFHTSFLNKLTGILGNNRSFASQKVNFQFIKRQETELHLSIGD